MRYRLVLLLTLLPAVSVAQTTSPGERILELRGKVSALTYRVTDLKGNAVRDIIPEERELSVAESATETRINLSADVLFEFDRATLNPEAETMLRKAADLILQSSGSSVRIEGHTDSRGEESYNDRLSVMRAAAVRNWLSGSGRVPDDSMTIKGWGEHRPVAPNVTADGKDDPDGRQKNRRVEIVVSRSS